MTDKVQRLKSPPYPSLSLEQALQRAEQLSEVAKGFAIPLPSAATCWGYSPKSSSIPSVLGALNQFGLLEDQGTGENRRIRLSTLGEKILKDKRPDSEERKFAVREAALMPKVFKEMWDQYGTVDVDQGTIVYDLTLGRKAVGRAPYSETAARDVANNFNKSLSFAGFTNESEENVASIEENIPETDASISQKPRTDPLGQPASSNIADQVLDLSRGTEIFEERKSLDEGMAQLMWPKNLSKDSVEDMEYWLTGVLRQIKRRSEKEQP